MNCEDCSREYEFKREKPKRLLQISLALSFLTATGAGCFQLLKPVGGTVAPMASNIHTIGPMLLSAPALVYMLFSGIFSRKCVAGQATETDHSHVSQIRAATKANKHRIEYKSWGSE